MSDFLKGAPPAPVKFTDAWGFSKLDTYRDCPARFKYQFVQKMATPSAPALERGARVHDHLEMFLRGIQKDLHEEVEKLRDEVIALRDVHECYPESAWGFDRQWNWLKNWLMTGTWLRVKLDAHYRQDKKGKCIDFKTGKHRPASDEQVQLYAIAMFIKYPELEEVDVELWYIDAGKINRETYAREDVEHLKAKFEKMVAPVYADSAFRPTPSRLCSWCPFSRSQEGPCRY